MLPTREKAEKLLREAEKCNPGPWGNHSRVAAHCAEKIAMECDDLDSDKAYILGLLHDIGRKFGVRHLGHVYIGKFDTTDEKLKMIQDALKEVAFDDYDRLIQLCDSLAGAERVLDIEERMEDVRRRYGSYPQEKWNGNLALKKYFEEKTGKDIYVVVDKSNFRL
ncbi:MAG: HDOD domain-containing protein [Candidatus Gastranaerophilales bacterium]|nr:HDOD domain-containing protein [Candidatus Gastranaerophilales bacterium]